MNSRTAALSAIVLASLLLTAGSTVAHDPRLTMHLLLRWGAEPLDWEDEESLALVVLPDDSAEPVARELAITDPTTVEHTLAANFPDLSEDEVGYLADLFLEAFESRGEVLRANFVAAPLIHVRADGSEFLGGDANRIFSNEPPAEGATAKTGPEGHILLLGEFYVEQNTSRAASLPASSYTLTADEEAIPIQVAIVMFSR